MKESKHHYKPNYGNSLSESMSISKSAAKDEAPISDEVWDEFNAMLEADEEANVAATNTTTTSTTNNDEKLNSTKSTEDDRDTTQRDNEISPTSDTEELNDDKVTNKDDLYDNDDTNTMEQTSYEARLARLILLKSKKKKKHTQEMNGVASESTDLPSASDFYDPSLAWAEDDEDDFLKRPPRLPEPELPPLEAPFFRVEPDFCLPDPFELAFRRLEPPPLPERLLLKLEAAKAFWESST